MVVYNDEKWNLEKRFSDFAELDSALDEEYKSNEDIVVRPCLLSHSLSCSHSLFLSRVLSRSLSLPPFLCLSLPGVFDVGTRNEDILVRLSLLLSLTHSLSLALPPPTALG